MHARVLNEGRTKHETGELLGVHGVALVIAQSGGAGRPPMSLTLKLLGPDVPQDFNLTVDSSLTVTQVKEKARSEWPDGARAHRHCQLSARVPLPPQAVRRHC